MHFWCPILVPAIWNGASHLNHSHKTDIVPGDHEVVAEVSGHCFQCMPRHADDVIVGNDHVNEGTHQMPFSSVVIPCGMGMDQLLVLVWDVGVDDQLVQPHLSTQFPHCLLHRLPLLLKVCPLVGQLRKKEFTKVGSDIRER